jgi:hypothetical protein
MKLKLALKGGDLISSKLNLNQRMHLPRSTYSARASHGSTIPERSEGESIE